MMPAQRQYPLPLLPPPSRFERVMRWVAAVLILIAVAQCAASPAPAQVVHAANYAPTVFDGWKRCTVDVMPPHEAGQVPGARYVLGRPIGLDVRVIDLQLRLDPGEVRSIDLSAAQPLAFVRGPLPAAPLAFFGQPSIAGVPLQVVGLQPDGAGYLAHLRARVGPMLCCDLWLWWYPDAPGWAVGEVIITASNPSVPDATAAVPGDLCLLFGAADVVVPGLQPEPSNLQGARAGGARLLPAGGVLADGQARSFPLVLVWRQHLRTVDDSSSAGAAANLSVCANGIARLWPDGNPTLAAGTSPLAWTISHWAGAIASLHRWAPEPGVGPNPRSPDTGAQADQVFVGAECIGPAGLGAEQVRYLVALSQSRRPCHHLEIDGSLLRLAQHPQLKFWDGRAHYRSDVSPDRLGKSRLLAESETQGWWGPDVEHWLFNNLTVAARLTGSPALQWQLEAQARVFLLQWVTFPYAYAARAVGWEALGVLHLWHNLEDRALAEQVRAGWLRRLDTVLLPQLLSKPNDWWDVHIDPRLGTGEWVMPWQQAVGAYWVDRAGATFGRADARALALRGARRAMDAWQLQGGQWLTYWNLAVDGRGVLSHDANNFGMPLAPAVVLRHEPNDEKARAVWAQVAPDGGQWIAPGVR